MSKEKVSKVKTIFVICFIIIFVLSVISPQINKIALYIIIPCLFIFSYLKKPRLIFISKPLLLFMVLIIWSLITTVAAVNTTKSLEEIRLLVSVFVFSYVIIFFAQENILYVKLFYFLYILRFFSLIYLGYILGVSSIDLSTERFNLDEINANTFGYLGYFAVVSSFIIYRVSFVKFKYAEKNYLYFIFLLVTITSGFFMVFYAATRAGLLIIGSTVVLLSFFTFLYPLSKNVVLTIIIITISFTIVVPIGLKFYSGTHLQYRLENKTNKEDERVELLKRAFEIGMENPVFGVGPGNFSTKLSSGAFSHSTYFEIFANNGFLGLFLFMALFVDYFKTNIKLFKLKNINDRRIGWYFMVFLITYMIYNLFYVFHTSLFLLPYFFLVKTHMELFLKNKLIKRRVLKQHLLV